VPEKYQDLLSRMQRLHRLSGAMALLGWDQEVTMPPSGARSRAGHRAALAEVIHEKLTDPELGTLLTDLIPDGDLSPAARANLRELKRERDRAIRLPAELVRDLAEASALAQPEWARARDEDDWDRFAPHLSRLVALKRREAAALTDEGSLYDALLDSFEPGAKVAELAPVFDRLRTALTDLIGRFSVEDPTVLPGPFPVSGQATLSRQVLEAMGYDFAAGRIDISAHPFTETMGLGDVRITTIYDEADVLSGISSSMHEGGHALYEQGLPEEHRETPAGHSLSLGIHESQSRLWENHVGRSLPFCRWLLPQLKNQFPALAADLTVNELYRASNVVRPSLIRTDADEVTYNLHIVLRMELEQALIEGDLEAADVPAAWNNKVRQYLGIEVPDNRTGALQDIHWCSGAFGYFPSYTLGNLYGAMFWQTARQDLPDLDNQMATGDLTPLLQWLRTNIHERGSILTAGDLCREVTGQNLTADHFIAYLETKFGALQTL